MKLARISALVTLVFYWAVLLPSAGRTDEEALPKIHYYRISTAVYCLQGPGGNVGMVMGDKGVVLIDTALAQAATALKKKIGELSPQPVKYIIDTHFHADHTGNNQEFGPDVLILSQVNCRTSLLEAQKEDAPANPAGIPSITYSDKLFLYLAGNTITLYHPGPAHTNGDTVVSLDKEKILFTGDLYFNGLPPYIDVAHGADTANWIKALTELAQKYPDYTVVPGHGSVSDIPTMLKFVEYLTYLRAEVSKALAKKLTREEAQAQIDLKQFERIQDVGEFLTKKNNIGWIYDELAAQTTVTGK